MNKINLGKTATLSSEIVLGCMRINNKTEKEVASFIDVALSEGINMFDHADIYGKGYCEELFGKVFSQNPSLREKLQIQSKCGIRPGYYDFSKEHILKSVEGSLKRLNTDYLDVFLLHRPDTLMEPEEIAEAFDILQAKGMVRNFGVSNFNSMQIEMLKSQVKQPILVNQMQFSIAHSGLVDSGILANSFFEGSIDRHGSVLEYCRLKNITLQAWSPFYYGFFEGIFIDNDKFPKLNEVIGRIANERGVTKSAVAIAWILRHPAKMQAVVGTTSEERLRDICRASDVNLTRQEWYEIFKASGKKVP